LLASSLAWYWLIFLFASQTIHLCFTAAAAGSATGIHIGFGSQGIVCV